MDTEILIVAALLALLVAGVLWTYRPRKIVVNAALPADFPGQAFSHDAFERLLQQFVSPNGRVDYGAWHASTAALAHLDEYLAAVSRFSPDFAPERFPTRDDELAYWMYGYNAWVVKGVLMHWPLSSVTDVKAPLEVVRGLGFFHQLRFPFGGKFLSLLAVENRQIRKRFRDPRIHFVLNCASGGCPVARAELPSGEELDRLLETATTDFINDANNVVVDHDRKAVMLSRIFRWYRKDFGRDLLAYLETVAQEPLLNDLQRARDYSIEFFDYDWRLNDAR